MSHNSITKLSSGVFQRLSLLKKLDLSYNDIVHLDKGIFLGLNSLKTLFLNDNPFKLSPAAFADDVFKPLESLTYLNLKSKVWPHDIQTEYPDVALGKLRSLETLEITGLSSTVFGKGVKYLVSLKTLDFSGSTNFKSLSKETFQSFQNINISVLNLSSCDLRWIDCETFVDLPYIHTIDYSFNRKLELSGVGNSTFGLQNSTIRKIMFQAVQPEFSMATLKLKYLQYLKHTRLEEFHAQNNGIDKLSNGALRALPRSLKVLNVSWNNIQTSRNQFFYILRLRKVEKFDASYQEVYTSPKPALAFDKTVYWINTTKFDVKSNMVSHRFHEDTSKLGYLILPLPPNMWLVKCSHTYKLRFTIPQMKLINSSVEVAKFSDNLLHRWEGPVVGLETMRHLDLSGNNCGFVSPHFFGCMTGLKTLKIGTNHLGPRLNDITFKNLTCLRHLYLDSNNLEDVGSNLFSSLSDLRSLNLSRNYLSQWNANISRLRCLEVLDLSYNKLTSLPKRLLDDLDSIRESRSVRLDIHGNLFSCTCRTKNFVHWFTGTKVKFRNLETTFCALANGTRVSLTKNEIIWKHLNSSCRSYSVLIGVSSGCLVIILVIFCGSLIYRYRWKLRYLYYMAANRRERTGYQRLDSAEDKPFGFDAFISYEDSDRAFIKEHVIPRLEGGAGLKLCIDKRDFIAGLYVTDNIMNAIQNSRKTVVLLSGKFLQSKWCMYELNMARMEGLYSDRRLLVIVVLEQIPTGILAAEILKVIHGQTYIEKTENEYGQVLFWEKLIEAIKSDM